MKKVLAFLALLFAPILALGQATQLTGTLNNPDGSGYNGQLTMSLAQQASIASASGCGGPVFVPPTVQVIIKIVNGAMQNAPKIYGSDCTLPYGVPYDVTARDNNGNVDFTAQWLPLGTVQDIGTIQTVINPLGTLFGLSLGDLALTGAQNVFTQNNTFTQNVTINGSLTVDGTITGPVGGPVVVQGTGGAVDFQVNNTIGTTVLQVLDNQNVLIPNGDLTVGGLINTNSGYFFDGSGGSAGQCLVSNGNAFVPGACTATIPSVFYQKVFANGVLLPQRSSLDVLPRLTVTDSAPNNWSFIDLAASGVTPSTYAYPSSMTVDIYGRVTGVTAGSINTQVLKAVTKTSGLCTTAQTAFAQCANTIVWPSPGFADANYTPVCTPGTPTNLTLTAIWIDRTSISATGMTVWTQNGDASGAHATSLSSLFCIGIHN